MKEYNFKCKKCGEEFKKEFNNVVDAIKDCGIHSANGCSCGGLVVFSNPETKYEKMKNSTCTTCPDKNECPQIPEILSCCIEDALEYRLRTGKFGISGGAGELSKDINGVIIDGTPVYVKDIKRLFVARTDTYSLYPKKYTGREAVPQTHEPVTDDIILQALMGYITIGFLPLDPETGLYRWLCYDVDKHSCEGTIYESNPRHAVDELKKNLKECGLIGYIETSGSPDSYHIWIFILPTDKEFVYKFDKDFKAKCNPLLNQAICRRVETGDGRMIKMPYAINLKNGVRGKFIDGVDLHQIQPEKLPAIVALR